MTESTDRAAEGERARRIEAARDELHQQISYGIDAVGGARFQFRKLDELDYDALSGHDAEDLLAALDAAGTALRAAERIVLLLLPEVAA